MKPRDQQPLARRAVLAGAGTAGALAAVAAMLPGREAAKPTPLADVAQTPAADDDGYRLTEHVKQYYRTARV